MSLRPGLFTAGSEPAERRRSADPTPAPARSQAVGTVGCRSIRRWPRPAAARPVDASARRPVLLVHGYAGTEHMWQPLRTALHAAGFDHVIALRYNTFRSDIHLVADWLIQQADRTVAAGDAGRVHLVGHSLGGLIIRDAVARGLGERVAAAVTVATPHHGSPLARFAPGPCARQMHPGSAFLRELEAETGSGPTRWIDIRGASDRVAPAGADPRTARTVLVRAGHRSIVRRPDVVARIVRELVAADNAPAGDRYSLAA